MDKIDYSCIKRGHYDIKWSFLTIVWYEMLYILDATLKQQTIFFYHCLRFL